MGIAIRTARRALPLSSIAAAIAISLPGITIVGCSTKSEVTSSPEAEVRSFMADYLELFKNPDADKQWGMLCASQQRWYDENPVRKEQLGDQVPGDYAVKSVSIQGDTAIVSLTDDDSADSSTTDIPLRREGGGWKICEE